VHEYLKTNPVSSEIDPHLWRHAAIRSFHNSYFHKDNVPDSPLAPIAYLDPVTSSSDTAKIPDYAKSVMDVMLAYPWFETYGLSYDQTMQLPFDEWRCMANALDAKVQRERDDSTKTAELTKQATQLLMVLLQRQTKQTPT
jgi:hypothetical protein